jgi:hypothetical protein
MQGRSSGVRQQMGTLVLSRDGHVMTGRASGFGLQGGVWTDGQLVGDREFFVAAGRPMPACVPRVAYHRNHLLRDLSACT